MPAPKINSDTIEKSFFKIGEVAALLNVNVSLIRFWEKEFPQIKPSKNIVSKKFDISIKKCRLLC
jgi:hypothetical protein